MTNRSKSRRASGRTTICSALFTAAAALAAPASHAEWSALQALSQRTGANVTALAVDLTDGTTLQSLRADERLTPASLTKLVLAAAALETWDVDTTFATRMLATSAPRDGLVAGDLFVQGEGDPSLEHRDLWTLAAQVKLAGVQEVSGGLQVSAQPFGLLSCETKDRCDALSRGLSAFDAPLSAFGVDYGSWCVDVKGSVPGAPAGVLSCAGVDVPVPLRGMIRTNPANALTSLWLSRGVAPAGGDTLDMGGVIAAGSGNRLYRSTADPALGAGLLLKRILGEMGVLVRGPVTVTTTPAPTGAKLLAEVRGLPVREQVGRLLRFSNNYVSDMLTLGVAAQRTPDLANGLAESSRALGELVVRARQASGYALRPPPTLLSGSGLTPENSLSAMDLVALLELQYRSPQTFPVFYGGLVVPAQAPNPSLRLGDSAWRDRVALKTGTLSEPYNVFGTAGYLRRKDGGFIAYAALVNARPSKPVPMRQSLAAIRADVEHLLAER